MYKSARLATNRHLASDHCIYVYQGTGEEKIILAYHVDDIICNKKISTSARTILDSPF